MKRQCHHLNPVPRCEAKRRVSVVTRDRLTSPSDRVETTGLASPSTGARTLRPVEAIATGRSYGRSVPDAPYAVPASGRAEAARGRPARVGPVHQGAVPLASVRVILGSATSRSWARRVSRRQPERSQLESPPLGLEELPGLAWLGRIWCWYWLHATGYRLEAHWMVWVFALYTA